MTEPIPSHRINELESLTESHERGQSRAALRRPIRFLEVTAPMHGEVLDVSPRGLRIETTEPLYVGSRRTFSLTDSMGRRQKLAGYVRWSRLVRTYRKQDGETVPVYVCGVERCLSLEDPTTIHH